MRDDNERLNDILDVIGQIEKYFDESRYESDEPYRHGMVNYLTIIGEAAKAITEETRALAEGFEWRSVIRFRDKVVHRYYEVDWDVVLDILQNRVSELKQVVFDLKVKIEKN